MLESKWRAGTIERHDDGIEPYGFHEHPVIGKPPERGSLKTPGLEGPDGLERRSEAASVPGLDFHHHDRVPLTAHEIELTHRSPLISGHHPVTTLHQKIGGRLLARPAPSDPVRMSACRQFGLPSHLPSAIFCAGQVIAGTRRRSSSLRWRLAGKGTRTLIEPHGSDGALTESTTQAQTRAGACLPASTPAQGSEGRPHDRRPLSPHALREFQAVVRQHYRDHGRDLPWRRTRDPYLILVSEFMLQQTQVARVTGKFELFIGLFPTIRSLAAGSTADVLRAWQGLGYNRRGLNLHRSARMVVAEHGGSVPDSLPELLRLPGVGRATAAAVCAFAFGIPVPFLETNVRAAFIHHFFQECSRVSDSELLPLVEATLDRDDPREWYYALMDYGSWLKKAYVNPSRRSKHRNMQSPFSGSHRQLRSEVLRTLLSRHSSHACKVGGAGMAADEVAALLRGWHAAEVEEVLGELAGEGFLRVFSGRYEVT